MRRAQQHPVVAPPVEPFGTAEKQLADPIQALRDEAWVKGSHWCGGRSLPFDAAVEK